MKHAKVEELHTKRKGTAYQGGSLNPENVINPSASGQLEDVQNDMSKEHTYSVPSVDTTS